MNTMNDLTLQVTYMTCLLQGWTDIEAKTSDYLCVVCWSLLPYITVSATQLLLYFLSVYTRVID